MTVSAPQLGKSRTLGCWLLALAFIDGGGVPWPSWWAAPTIAQAHEGFLRYVVKAAKESGIYRSHTESSPMRLVLSSGSVLEARSWERPEGLYGPTVARIAVDEFGLLDDAAWAALSSRTTETAIHGFGQLRMAGNVSEIGGIAEALYRKAESGSPGWSARTWTWRHRASVARCGCGLNGEGMSLELADRHDLTCERGIYLRDLAARQSVMSKNHFRQLYEAEWLDWSALPAYEFVRAVHVTADVHEEPSLPLELSCDFNVGPMAWVIGQHKGSEAWALDEIAIEGGATTSQACDLFLERYPDGGKRDLVVYGDASGHSHGTKSTESDYDIIRTKLSPAWPRIRFAVGTSNPAVTGRLNAVNAMLRPADGSSPRYYLHPRCEKLANDLARVSLKPGTRDLDKGKDKSLTHFSDADGYRLAELFPISRPSAVVVPVSAPMPDIQMGVQWQ